MTYPTSVNAQITDSVPPETAGSIYQALAASMGLAMQNAVSQQQQLSVIAQAATAQAVSMLYAIDTATAGAATAPAISPPTPGELQKAVDEATRAVSAARAEPAQAAIPQADDAVPVQPHPAIDYLLNALERMNAISVRQSIRVVELAAVTTIVTRAIQVNTGESGAQDQMALWTGLLETVIRDFNAWAESVG
ncbi:MAG TPA: RebB family R body protein [Longimicrobium sp.]|nr:RebB family R body protein [Longimicrobium sp.]